MVAPLFEFICERRERFIDRVERVGGGRSAQLLGRCTSSEAFRFFLGLVLVALGDYRLQLWHLPPHHLKRI